MFQKLVEALKAEDYGVHVLSLFTCRLLLIGVYLITFPYKEDTTLM